MTDVQARDVAAAEVSAVGEELLWSGRPGAARMALQALPVALFGVPFASFSLFWMASAARFRWPDLSRGGFELFPLFGIPFAAVGAFLVLAPLFAFRGARRTVYGVSRSGVWIIRAGRARSVERHAVEDGRELRTTERRDGSGDLVVGRRAVPGRGGQWRFQDVTLVGIPDVRRVARIVASLAPPAAGAAAEPRLAPANGYEPREASRPSPRAPQPRGTVAGRRSRAAVSLVGVAVALASTATVVAVLARGRTSAPVEREEAPAQVSREPAEIAHAPPTAPPPAPPAPAPVASEPEPAAAALAAEAPTPPPSRSAAAVAELPQPPVRFASYAEQCEGGDGSACLRAGSELRQGLSGPADPASAARMFARGCELGTGGACRSLGWMLQRGDGLPADRRAAAGWLVRACELGDLEGCRGGGFALAYGEGVPADRRRAVPMLERACAAGHLPRACAALGDVLEKGAPSPDPSAARAAYRRGCAQRDGDCCDRAARMAAR